MSRRITAGNDAPFRWAVKLQGKPFDLSGKDVKVYVINSRGDIPVARLTIEGNEVSGVFEGRYQTRLGEHSLVLRVNEGRPEMKTAAVANVFELVQWSADAGGSNEGDVIVAPVLIESELSIGMGGGSYDDTEVKEELARLEREKADKSELTELSAEVSKKQDTITDLETIRSGAAKGATAIQEVKTINGQSIVGSGNIEIQGGGGGGMTTPSGDPMHYMFEAVGATYNATDADIPMVGIYGDSYVHKAKHWHLNELGDITNEEMREVYVKSANLCNMVGLDRALASTKIRTNIPIIDRELPLMGALARMEQNMGCFAANSKCETICIFSSSIPMTSATCKEYKLSEGNGMFFGCSKLKKVLNVLPISKMSSVNRLLWEAPVIEEIRANGLKTSIEVKHSPVLSNASILYMIENEIAASAIVITLHADVYARAMADTEILAALEAHPNVSLASA